MSTILHDDAAERAAVAACLNGGETTDAVAAVLTAGDFANPAHREIAATAFALAEAGHAVTVATVQAELARGGRLAGVGGPAYLAGLATAAVAGSELASLAARVRDAADRRNTIAAMQRLIVEMRNPDAAFADAVAATSDELDGIATAGPSAGDGTRDAWAAVAEGVRRLCDRGADAARAAGVVATGVPELDRLLGGGLKPGTSTALAARTGVGKTALALLILLHAAYAGVGGLLISLEMSCREVADRFLSMLSGVDSSRVGGTAPLTADEIEQLTAVTFGGAARVWVADRPGQTAARIAATARRAVRRHGVGLIVVDYLQLVHPENPRDARHLQVGTVATRLKELARTLNVPVLVLAQLNREVENRQDGRPRLSDLRDSGQIEQDADAVILLHPTPTEPGAECQAIDLLLEKNRHGPRGVVPMRFRRKTVRFESPDAATAVRPKAKKPKQQRFASDDRPHHSGEIE
ncbi:replicative DNA helicase [Limnoglobus roseus]|uniref:DNA 5'-3' helicase n=1 Tax=Limnoglobus roseus TaxID=2598579 RepID=A0A5C1A8W3_9BACT|nr:DnaB-like helicase C-terminal domain-containing protein [Limnoglobus roseus]QEL15621.1 replicative DNA helicase [Limnoglobus roseus]